MSRAVPTIRAECVRPLRPTGVGQRVEHILHTHADAGVGTARPAVVVGLFRCAVGAGHAEDGFSSLVG